MPAPAARARQVAPPQGFHLALSPYMSIVLGISLSAIFCLAAGLCHRYGRLDSLRAQVWPSFVTLYLSACTKCVTHLLC